MKKIHILERKIRVMQQRSSATPVSRLGVESPVLGTNAAPRTLSNLPYRTAPEAPAASVDFLMYLSYHPR